MKKLYLASNSKSRKDILDNTGLHYTVKPSNIEEHSSHVNPGDYCVDLSYQKAKAVSNTLKGGVILSADSIIYFEGVKLEKPKSKKEAFDNLKMLSGKTNVAVTGVTLIDLYQNKELSFYEETEVTFNELTDDEINWYIENEQYILERAGYSIAKANIFISSIKGDYYNIIGLPIARVYTELKNLGYTITDFK